MKDVIVKVIAGSSKNYIEHFGDNRFLVKVQATEHSEINKDVVEALSKYTGTPPERIKIICGHGTQNKIFKII